MLAQSRGNMAIGNVGINQKFLLSMVDAQTFSLVRGFSSSFQLRGEGIERE